MTAVVTVVNVAKLVVRRTAARAYPSTASYRGRALLASPGYGVAPITDDVLSHDLEYISGRGNWHVGAVPSTRNILSHDLEYIFGRGNWPVADVPSTRNVLSHDLEYIFGGCNWHVALGEVQGEVTSPQRTG